MKSIHIWKKKSSTRRKPHEWRHTRAYFRIWGECLAFEDSNKAAQYFVRASALVSWYYPGLLWQFFCFCQKKPLSRALTCCRFMLVKPFNSDESIQWGVASLKLCSTHLLDSTTEYSARTRETSKLNDNTAGGGWQKRKIINKKISGIHQNS